MHDHDHVYDPAVAERKQKNRDIFAETMRICREGGYITPSGVVVRLPDVEEVLKASVFYRNPPKVDSIAVAESSMYDAVNDDCIEVTRKLVEEGYKPIMLNMANRHNPGGGVINGARAQEESLFRQSNLCVSLYQYDEYHAGLLGLPPGNGRYPMDRETGGIYSGRVTFFRRSPRDGDALVEKPFECAVVSVAAINRPDLTPDGRLVDWAVAATKKKIRTILRIGLLHGHDAIVLGAWGCGAFRNPPKHMAQLFHEVLDEVEFARKFRIVRFAVIEDHNSRHSNFAPFDEEFNRGQTKEQSRNARSVLDDSGFPVELTAEMLADFQTTPRGCTQPRVGEIGGHRFIAKCGSWSSYSSDEHVHNEFVADNLLRSAGFNVPDSREYRVDFGDGRGAQAIRLAVYDDTLKPIMEVWENADDTLRAKMRAQAVSAYPVQALIAGIDTFTYDNVKVDPDGNLWFVDNGASFDFRACGKRKGWFWDRHEVCDPQTGYLSLAKHPDQHDLRRILGKVDDSELWSAAKECRITRLVAQLPETYRKAALMDYATALETAVKKQKGKQTMDRNKAKGMLWGLIVGDAFGSPIQFTGKDKHPWITEMVACPVFGLPPGYWTDDGSMAMCIMDSYVRNGGYNLKDIAATFVEWLKEGYLSSVDGRSFDVGGATYSSVTAFAHTGSLVNGREDSQGNGSIMRFSPSYLIAQKERDPAKVMHEISDLTHSSARVREVVDRFAKVLGEHMSGKRTTEVSPYKTREEVNNSGWAVSTLQAALWAFNTTESFEEGLVAAVNLGGDSDSIGAVLGQIAGAYYGFEAIPERWIKAVKTWRKVDALIEDFLDAVGG